MAFQSNLTALVNIPDIVLPANQAWNWNFTFEKDKEGTLVAGDSLNGSIFIGFYNGGRPTIQTEDGQLTINGTYTLGEAYTFNISSDGLGTLTLSVGEESGSMPIIRNIPINLFLKYKQNRDDFKFTGVAYGLWTFTGIPGGDRSYDWDQPIGTGVLPDIISGYDGTIENVGLGGFIVTSDTTKPVIELFGDNPLIIEQGSIFLDPAYTAIDNVDGDVTNQVVVDGVVDTNTVGSYTLTYTVTDSSGNVSDPVTRVVTVVEDPGGVVIVDGVTINTNTTSGNGLDNCVINSLGMAFSLPIKLNNCSVFVVGGGDSYRGDGEFAANSTVIVSDGGQCFSADSRQLGTASTDNSARTYRGIDIASNFRSDEPNLTGDFRLDSNSLLGNYSIGAFLIDNIVNNLLKVKVLMAGVSKVISSLVGSELSTIGLGANELPSVFLLNSKPTKPDHPYAVVSHKSTKNIGLSTRDSFVTDFDGETVNTYSKEVVIRTNFYGGVEDDTASIASLFHDKVYSQSGLDTFNSIVGQPLVDLSDVATNSSALSTSFEEVSTIDLRLAITVLYKEVNDGTIEIINMNGRLVDHDSIHEINTKSNIN